MTEGGANLFGNLASVTDVVENLVQCTAAWIEIEQNADSSA